LPLSRDRVVVAALALIDAEGLEALTMRRLGRALGVEAMSIYKHAAGKDDVLDGVAELVMAGVELPAASEDWAADLRAIALSLRDTGLRHPAGFELLVRRLPVTERSMAPIEATLAALRAGGFDDATTIRLFWALVAYVLGAVLAELGAAAEAAQGRPVFPGTLTDLATAHPTLSSLGPALAACDFETEFIWGLNALLSPLGIDRQIGLADV